MEEFTGKEELIGLLVTDGDADAPNEKSYIKNAENETETTLGLFQMWNAQPTDLAWDFSPH